MNVRTLTPTLEHIVPDLASIRSNRSQIKSKVTALDDIYVPILQEKLKALYVHLNRVEDSVQEVLARSPVALRSSGIRTMLQSILDTDKSSALRPAYIAELTDYLDSALDRVTTLTDKLSASLDQLNTFDSGETANFVVDMEKQIDLAETNLKRINQQNADTQKEIDEINEAMRYLEDKTIFDELSPLVEALKYMDPRNPGYSVIRAAVASVQNILRIASEAVKYKDMVEARAEVRTRLAADQEQQRETQQQIRTLTTRIQQLNTLASITTCQTNYEQEIRKINKTLGTFLSGQENMSRDDMLEYARIFIAQANDMAVYLEDLSTRWK